MEHGDVSSPRGAARAGDRIRVACAVPYPDGVAPGQRFRWEQWAPLLRQSGVEIDFIRFATPEMGEAHAAGRLARAVALGARRWPHWLGEVLAARHADLLVVYRGAALGGPPVAELLLNRLGLQFVYDFDDAIYLPNPYRNSRVRRILRADWRVPVLCRRAALVSVGNPTLAEFAARHNHRWEVWPTTISMASYPARPAEPASEIPTIGWMGSPSTVQYLEPLLPALRELQRQHRFRLLVVGGRLPLEGVQGDCAPWTADTEVSSLHRMDIGLMPLPDDPWARGKCGAKALQYMGVGVPAVVSDVGVNRDIVPDGVGGFVVNTPREWNERMSELLSSREMRIRMGAAGREHVARRYSAEVWAPRIAARLRAVVTQTP